MWVNRFVLSVFLVLVAAFLALGVLLLLPAREGASIFPEAPAQAVTPPISEELSVPLPAQAVPLPARLGDSQAATGWEDRLTIILSSEDANQATVRQLLDGLQSLPIEAQQEYIAHALNLSEDEDYTLIEVVYFSPGLAPEVSEEIFNDVLNRSDEIKLPLLAKTLRRSDHPMSGEAREILEMYLDAEEGSVPPGGWEAAVQAYLVQDQGQ
jgi:hypothetical protein